MFVNEQMRRVKWSDCDPAGIIFNPNYYRWMDDGAFMLLRAAGFDLKSCRAKYPDLIGWPLVSSGMEFFKPPSFGDELIMRSEISRLGNSSFDVDHQFLSSNRQIMYAKGTEARVWAVKSYEKDAGMSAVTMPEDFRAALKGIS